MNAKLIGMFCVIFPVSTQAVEVLNGIDVLVKQNFAPLYGHVIGLITNHTGHDRERNATIDLLVKAPGVTLKALFSPEHGIRGIEDAAIDDSKDGKTGLSIYSLYGKTYAPTQEHLKGLTALVFDIQDIGCRFYTYVSTLGHCLEAAAKAKLAFFVLDRVNPITGVTVDGPVLDGNTSFIAYHPIPVRHGMTVGELAVMFNKEKNLGADLHVIQLEGWKRTMWFDETELPWTNPSPNMRNLAEATLYPGIGLLEMSNLSVGRGTDTPFEIIGAPYINDRELAYELQKEKLPGVTFVPVRFKPQASIFKDTWCQGANIIVLDREKCSAIDIGITIAKVLYRLYKEQFKLERVNILMGHADTPQVIKENKPLNEIRKLWASPLQEFQKRRAHYLLYR